MNKDFLTDKQFKKLVSQLTSYMESSSFSDNSIQYLIKWFCISNGQSNDYLHQYVKDNSETSCEFKSTGFFINNELLNSALISLVRLSEPNLL